MMRCYVEEIINELIKESEIRNFEGICKWQSRKIYFKGCEYEEQSVELIFLIKNDDLFKKTVAFTISIDSFSCDIEVKTHFSCCNKVFKTKAIRAINEYILCELEKNKTV